MRTVASVSAKPHIIPWEGVERQKCAPRRVQSGAYMGKGTGKETYLEYPRRGHLDVRRARHPVRHSDREALLLPLFRLRNWWREPIVSADGGGEQNRDLLLHHQMIKTLNYIVLT